MIETLTGILSTATLAGGVLALAAQGGMLANRVGVLNLGLEGLIAIGGITAIVTVGYFPNPYLGFLAALLAGAIIGAIFASATTLLQANQVLCGLALAIAGSGTAATIGRSFAGKPAAATFAPVKVTYLSNIPIIGPAFFSQNILIYVAFFLLPVALHFVLYHTRHGLAVRAVGENPAAVDAAGISVTRLRFLYVVFGCAISASAGAYLTLAFIPSWSDGLTAGRGWISVALIIFAGYAPIGIAIGALFFGSVSALSYVGQAQNWPIPSPILQMLPYIATLVAMILPAMRKGHARRSAPEALGLPYFREQR